MVYRYRKDNILPILKLKGESFERYFKEKWSILRNSCKESKITFFFQSINVVLVLYFIYIIIPSLANTLIVVLGKADLGNLRFILGPLVQLVTKEAFKKVSKVGILTLFEIEFLLTFAIWVSLTLAIMVCYIPVFLKNYEIIIKIRKKHEI